MRSNSSGIVVDHAAQDAAEEQRQAELAAAQTRKDEADRTLRGSISIIMIDGLHVYFACTCTSVCMHVHFCLLFCSPFHDKIELEEKVFGSISHHLPVDQSSLYFLLLLHTISVYRNKKEVQKEGCYLIK
jgi:hypothetical protein